MNVLPLPTPEPEFSLRGLVGECVAVSEETDPKVLAEEICTAVPEYALRDALGACLPEYVRRAVTQVRSRRTGESTPPTPSWRWASVRAAQASGALAIYRWRVNVGADWKFFEDCTRDDVAHLVADYRQRAGDLADQAQRYGAVLELMNEIDAARVGGVPIGRLEEIFNA